MKSTFLFSTKLAVYWVEIPIILLMTVAIHYNAHSSALLKLYPLIVFLGLAIAFVLVYFFRGIQVSYDEIRHVGLFSARESAMITEGKTIIIDLLKGGRLDVTLFGNDGKVAELDWLKDEEEPLDIDLFKGKAIGGRYAALRLILLWGFTEADATALCSADEEYSVASELATAWWEDTEGHRRINIRVDKTV